MYLLKCLGIVRKQGRNLLIFNKKISTFPVLDFSFLSRLLSPQISFWSVVFTFLSTNFNFWLGFRNFCIHIFFLSASCHAESWKDKVYKFIFLFIFIAFNESLRWKLWSIVGNEYYVQHHDVWWFVHERSCEQKTLVLQSNEDK